MQKQLFGWIAVGIIIVCCMLGGIVWQIIPVFSSIANYQNQSPTPTPIPVIERTPVVIAPTATSSQVQAEPEQPGSEVTSAATVTTESLSLQTSTPTETDTETPAPTPPVQLSTEQTLRQAVLPERDQRLLAIRLKNGGQDIPETVSKNQADLKLGDIDTFWVTDNQASPPAQIEATASLKYITDHSYWWVEDGLTVNDDALKRSAERFENQTYPTDRAFFGSEWSPGVDNDVRVHIFMGNVPGVAGYFSASNSYTKLAEPYSNEREMFFINLRAITPGNHAFDGVLAHEFQHMIHWHQDRNEDTWINEGLSELATFINGYGLSNFVGAYTYTPDTQLTSWSVGSGGTLANYGGSFLFLTYFLQRFGEELMQAVVTHPSNGVAGFDAVLAEQGYKERFNDIFADFLVANYLQNPNLNNGLWSYQDLSINPVNLTEQHNTYPVEQQTTVHQYGGDFIKLTGNGNITIEFTGSTQINVVNNKAHSGTYQWYSHRGDETNTRLTRAFNLSNVETATLNYWTWYDIEPSWDYGYVEISTDGGNSWEILQASHSSTTNPSGNAYGPGYTGRSGDGGSWVEESLDISDYTGLEVLIRFEYVTDDAVNHPGWTIDDISIPEIDFYDDVESENNGWNVEGFVRIDNVLPQKFLVQLLEFGAETTVRPIILDETNHGTFTIEGLGTTVDQAIMIVSGLALVTTEPAHYEYKITLVE